MMKLRIAEAKDLIQGILRTAGFNHDHARAVMETIIAGEIDGCASHGLWRTLGCVSTLKNGQVVPDACPRVEDRAAGILAVDAAGGFSPLAFDAGLPLLVEKARSQGIAAMAINHCVHFSALWVEIEKLTDQGLVAMAYTPSHAWVAPAGGQTPVFGTNPMAFGWPRKQHPAFIFDFATSAVARGEIQLHRREGKAIPEGWGIDRDGQPSTDAAEVLDNGAMLTFGGHKGSALAAMIELIAGPLIGDLTSAESLEYDDGRQSAPYHGELVIAISPQGFLGASTDQNLQRAEAMFDAILGQGARLPSQRRYLAREKSLAEGLEISDSLYRDLLSLSRAG